MMNSFHLTRRTDSECTKTRGICCGERIGIIMSILQRGKS